MINRNAGGQLIKETRKAQGKSQADISREAFIARETMRSIELGKWGNLDNVESVLNVLGLKWDDIHALSRNA